ncbi:MAG TPA: S26 family signal peptidase [Patescibacteria group bacterium]|nr:S26 family signal peptidase [Patescibacteria group bacterium]
MVARILTIVGHSMEPTIRNKQRVVLLNYPFLKYKVGHIVAFRYKGKIFVKRIVNIENGLFVLAGDNVSSTYDSQHFGPLSKNTFIGRVFV